MSPGILKDCGGLPLCLSLELLVTCTHVRENFVKNISGLSTACGDTPCKRIGLLVTSVLTIPFLIGFYVPVGMSLEFSLEEVYGYYSECLTSSGYNSNIYNLESLVGA